MKHKKFSILDESTGEILGEYKPRTPRRSGHIYILTYSKNLATSGQIIQPVEFFILSQMNGLNVIHLTNEIKKHMAIDIGRAVKTISNAITLMIEKDLIIRIGTGLYMANPMYFTKANKNKVMQLRDEYNRLKAEIKAENAKKKPKTRKSKKTTLKVINMRNDEDYPL